MRNFLRMSLCTFAVLALCPAVFSQDPFGGAMGGDPFGAAPGGDDPFNAAPGADAGFGGFGAAPAAAAAPANASTPAQTLDMNDPNPLVRIVRANPPKSPQEFSDAIGWMTQIKRWDEVGRLLTEIGAANWSQDQLANLSRSAGSALWIRLRGMGQILSEEQQGTVSQILRAPAEIAASPGWLDSWIAKLASDSPGEKQLAQLRLQDGNRAAIKRLADSLLVGAPNVSVKTLVETLLLFGQEGVDALKAASSVSDSDRSLRVLLGLAEFPRSGFSAELGAALHSNKFSQAQRDELSERIAKLYSSVPGQDSVKVYLANKYSDAAASYQSSRLSKKDLQDRVWKASSDGTIVSENSTVANGQLMQFARLAQLRLQVGELSEDDQAHCMAAILQDAYQSVPGLSSPLSAQDVFGQMNAPTADQLKAAFEVATKLDFHGGALRALQLAAQANRPSIAFFSELLNDTRPIIRYSALVELSKLNPTEPFGGEGAAVRTALEMNQLGQGPHALVVGLRSELLQAAQQQIQLSTAAKVTVANSARSALMALNGSDPIEMVFVVDRVSDQSLHELLQRIRNSKKGRSVPIAVVTDDLYPYERSLIDAQGGTITSVMSRDPSQMRRVIQLMQAELDTEPMSAEDRSTLALEAGRFITAITSQPEQYPFYPLGQLHSKIVDSTINLDQSSEIKVLAGLSTSASQKQLVKLAANARLGAQIVTQAANAFTESVRRGGLKLDAQTVKNCYDDYNRLAPTDPVVAKSLGHVLDSMEAYGGHANWPKPLR